MPLFESTAYPSTPGKNIRYPIVMHKGKYPDIHSLQAKSETEEEYYRLKGYSLQRPYIPQPDEPTTPLTVEERLLAIESRLEKLEGGNRRTK